MPSITVDIPNETIQNLADCVVTSVSPWVSRMNMHLGDSDEGEFWGGMVEFDEPTEDEGTFTGRFTITDEAVLKGLEAMATIEPRHFGDVLDGDAVDAETADVFMQCMVFGSTVYG